MRFIKSSDSSTGVVEVLSRLKAELTGGKKVLWLVCGGSSIPAEAEILNKLTELSLNNNLSIMLMDERYGDYGHKDSNWQQLLKAGADFEDLNATPVMSDPAQTLDATVSNYAKSIEEAMLSSDVVVGLFGLGADGHTAGILPNTPAVLDTSASVVAYDSPPYTRITLTKVALQKVDLAYVFTFGDSKKPALLDLQENAKSFKDLPSGMFWDLPEVYIYNDQIGEKL